MTWATALVVRYSLPDPVRLEVGGFDAGFLTGSWSAGFRADLDPQATDDGRTVFYYRGARPGSGIRLPVTPGAGPLRLTFRARASVRSSVGIFVGGRPAGEVLVGTGPWRSWSVDIPSHRDESTGLEVALAFRPLPLVSGDHALRPELLVDHVEVTSADGLVLSATRSALIALVPVAVFLFGLLVGTGPGWTLAASAIAAVAMALAMRLSPFSVLLAAPRILPVALLGGIAVHRILRRAGGASPREQSVLAWVMTAGVVVYGSLVFFPNHNPPALQPHVRRALILGSVPGEYQALLGYGSQLASVGEAIETFGENTLVPYSPFPFALYYALHLLGIDLYWGMTVANVVLAMAVAPWLWVVATALWSRGAAWVSMALYLLDIAVWFRVGRAHAPGALGGALATAALLYLALKAGRLDTWRRSLLAGALLGTAVLGYSSLVVLVGLFGLVLLLFVAVDAREWSRAARRGACAALVVGALFSGALYYFHYVPGILRGAGAVEAGIDPFPGRTFFIFHNESRQSIWIWMLGFRFLVPAGLLAAPFAFRTLRRPAGPVLASWLLAWACLMLLKEPFLFPKLMRWAKEDVFVSPLLCLFVGAMAWSVPRPWMRHAVAAVVLAVALVLQLRSYTYLANSLLV